MSVVWTIFLTNQSSRTDITPEWLAKVAAAMSEQLADFCLDWGLVRWIATTTPTPDAFTVAIRDVSPDPGAAGYHENPNNIPDGFAFVGNETLADCECTISHECLELVLDPDTQGFELTASGKAYARESCDAVEDKTYMASNGVTLSDYVLPNFFVEGASAPFDKLGVLTAPLTRTDGGYSAILEGGSVTTDPPEAAKKNAKKAHPMSRVSQRIAKVQAAP